VTSTTTSITKPQSAKAEATQQETCVLLRKVLTAPSLETLTTQLRVKPASVRKGNKMNKFGSVPAQRKGMRPPVKKGKAPKKPY